MKHKKRLSNFELALLMEEKNLLNVIGQSEDTNGHVTYIGPTGVTFAMIEEKYHLKVMAIEEREAKLFDKWVKYDSMVYAGKQTCFEL